MNRAFEGSCLSPVDSGSLGKEDAEAIVSFAEVSSYYIRCTLLTIITWLVQITHVRAAPHSPPPERGAPCLHPTFPHYNSLCRIHFKQQQTQISSLQ